MTDITDAFIKDATTEYLSHRGEQPYRVLRGGQQLWETHAPAMRHALTTATKCAAPTTSPEPDAVRDLVYEVALAELEKKRLMPTSVTLATAIANAYSAALRAPVAGTWPKPIAEAPRDADEILLVSFQEQGPNGLVYVSLNNGCWDEGQQCFVLGPRGCSTNAVGDGHSTHWLPRSWLPDVAATRKDRGSPTNG